SVSFEPHIIGTDADNDDAVGSKGCTVTVRPSLTGTYLVEISVGAFRAPTRRSCGIAWSLAISTGFTPSRARNMSAAVDASGISDAVIAVSHKVLWIIAR